MAGTFDEKDHPRKPKGVRDGGQFTEKPTNSQAGFSLGGEHTPVQLTPTEQLQSFLVDERGFTPSTEEGYADRTLAFLEQNYPATDGFHHFPTEAATLVGDGTARELVIPDREHGGVTYLLSPIPGGVNITSAGGYDCARRYLREAFYNDASFINEELTLSDIRHQSSFYTMTEEQFIEEKWEEATHLARTRTTPQELMLAGSLEDAHDQLAYAFANEAVIDDDCLLERLEYVNW